MTRPGCGLLAGLALGAAVGVAILLALLAGLTMLAWLDVATAAMR